MQMAHVRGRIRHSDGRATGDKKRASALLTVSCNLRIKLKLSDAESIKWRLPMAWRCALRSKKECGGIRSRSRKPMLYSIRMVAMSLLPLSNGVRIGVHRSLISHRAPRLLEKVSGNVIILVQCRIHVAAWIALFSTWEFY